MSKNGPGWYKDRRRHQEAAKMGWQNRLKGMKPSHSPSDLHQIQAERPQRARAADARKTAQRVIEMDSPFAKGWVNNPGAMDIEGIDTASVANNQKPLPSDEDYPKWYKETFGFPVSADLRADAYYRQEMTVEDRLAVMEILKKEHPELADLNLKESSAKRDRRYFKAFFEYIKEHRLKKGNVSKPKDYMDSPELFPVVEAQVKKDLAGRKINNKKLRAYADEKGYPAGWVEITYERMNPKTEAHLKREITDLEKKMEKYHKPAHSRAQATTREANAFQTGRILIARKTELRELQGTNTSNPAAPANTYLYGMISRPPGPGATPKGHTGLHPSRNDRKSKFGLIQYDRPLTDEELNHFSLVPYMSDKQVEKRAERIIGRWGRYAHKYLDMSEKKRRQEIIRAHSNLPGVPGVSAKDPDHTVEALDRKIQVRLKSSKPVERKYKPRVNVFSGSKLVHTETLPGEYKTYAEADKKAQEWVRKDKEDSKDLPGIPTRYETGTLSYTTQETTP